MKFRSILKPLFLLLLFQAFSTVRIHGAPLPLKTSGNQIVTSGGCTVTLRGVNVDGLEFSSNGEGPPAGNGGNTKGVITEAITAWHCNVIRLPINQDYWFGCSGANQVNYRGIIDGLVSYCSSLGVYIILDLHWSGTYSGTAATDPTGCSGGNGWGTSTAQQEMPDWNAVTFWSSVASHYSPANFGADNAAILYDIYNEPHPDSSLGNPQKWQVWLNGGATSNTPSQTPGMQNLLNAIRTAGSNNVVLAGGLSWAYDLSGITSGTYLLNDASGYGVIYSAHIYGTTKGFSSAAWDANVTNATVSHPVFLGEFGPDTSCPPTAGDMTSFDTTFFNWLSGTNNKSYVYPGATGWSMHTGSAPCMLTNWSYATTSWGQAVSTWLGTPIPTCPSGPTNTPTNTGTPTFTGTPTQTPTNTPTFTPTNTKTNTNTGTPSATPTNSFTPTDSGTATPTATFSSTPTDTFTGQPTDTPTSTPTITDTPTFTYTFTVTDTPTITDTPNGTNTFTSTYTPTFSLTPTATPQNTLTPTFTGTFTPVSFTATPTAVSTLMVSNPYPNPVMGTSGILSSGSDVVNLDVQGPGLAQIKFDVFTASFRKIRSMVYQASDTNHLKWDLEDMEGRTASNGIYFLRVEVDGLNGKTVFIKKLLILR